MSKRTINISFPVEENLLDSLKESEAEFTKNVRFSTALLFYRKGKLSLGKAAELAGYDRLSFIEKLQEEKEYVFDYNKEEMDEIFADVSRIK